MAMKLNLAYPQNGSQKLIELDDEKKTRLFYDRRLAEEVPADALGDEFKGYIVKITGGHDKQGFAMKQGVLLNHRTRLLLDGTTSGFHPWKRPGHRKRKSVRGCIIGPDIAVVNAIIVKKGAADLPGLTDPDSVKPSLRGPKRANNIRKLWGLTKEDDVRQFVSRKKIKDSKTGKPRYKSPKIQRLITPVMLHRKKRRLAIKKKRYEKSKKEAADYAALIANIRREKRKALIEKRRALSERKSERKSERVSQKTEVKVTTTKQVPAKAGKGKEAAKPDAKGAKTPAKQTSKGDVKGKASAAKQTSKGDVKGKAPATKQTSKGDVKGKTPATKQASKGDVKGKDAAKGKEQPAKADAKGKGPAKQTSKGEISKAQPATKQPSKSEAPKAQPAKGDKQPAKTTDKTAAKPAAQKPAQPAKQTKSEPAPEKPAGKPAADKPAAKPAAEKPAGKPAAEKPAGKPAAEKPAAKPAAEKPAAKPAAEKPAAKPAASPAPKPVAAEKPAAEKPAAKPAAQKPAQPKQGTGDKRPQEGGDKGPNKKPKK